MTVKTATLIRKLTGFQGDARLYRVDPPMAAVDWGATEPSGSYDHVIVSAVVAMFSGPETLIFPATPDGVIVDWGDMSGSFRGELDHEQALNNAGYEVVDAPAPQDGISAGYAVVGRFRRDEFKAMCDAVGVEYTEHANIVESSIAFRGPAKAVDRVRRWVNAACAANRTGQEN